MVNKRKKEKPGKKKILVKDRTVPFRFYISNLVITPCNSSEGSL